MKHFPKPTSTSDYFKGIIRSTYAFAVSTSSYYDYPNNANSLLQNNLEYFWHSSLDTSCKQYVEIVLPYVDAVVTSYMISSGSNGVLFYLLSWDLNCSLDGKHWTKIDTRKNEATFTKTDEMKIFDVKTVTKCKFFRFMMNGLESQGRYYMYIGPVELFGHRFYHML
jgi:hypothetical protein